MNSYKYDLTLDASGLFCPEPVMMLHKKIRQMEAGQVLYVKATDPSTQRDIPRFCEFLGHRLLDQSNLEESYEYFIQKGTE
ncbi:MAG: sulfurtransferase TusA [Oceanospirillales bacterium]|jgi:tRNA 2-thiouridine synthesizing protein A|nr:MAG: sulfurtransferase TusA [Oceanospirillales bacterium]